MKQWFLRLCLALGNSILQAAPFWVPTQRRDGPAPWWVHTHHLFSTTYEALTAKHFIPKSMKSTNQLYSYQNKLRPYEPMGGLKSYQENKSRELIRHMKQRNVCDTFTWNPIKRKELHIWLRWAPSGCHLTTQFVRQGTWQRPLDCPRGFSLSLTHCWCGLLSSDPGAWFCRGTPKRPPACS